MFITVLFVAVHFYFVSSTAVSNELSNVMKKFSFHKHLEVKKVDVKTGNHLRLKTSSTTAPAADPVTLLGYQYSNKDCSGEPTIVSGNAYNTCLTALDDAGLTVGTGIYGIIGTVDPYEVTSYYEFPSTDCSSPASYGEQDLFPLNCFVPSDAPSLASFQAVFSNETDVSKLLKNGVLFAYYDLEDRCQADGISSSFTWLKLGQCVTTDEGSMIVTGCGDGKLSVSAYSDNQCTEFKYSGQSAMQTCDRYEDGPSSASGFHYASYISHKCT